ncbi:MAG TPA: hypothetical protein ENH11_00065 [Candidatus Acetothermia bacterium]|nr:hypothetical protein [Candidatus Acetothermia bacterium]
MGNDVLHAMFVSANKQYMPYLNALLNSIHKRELCKRVLFDVIVLEDGSISDDYKEACQGFPFAVNFVRMDPEQAGLDPEWGSAWQCKAGRYFYIGELGKYYRTCCLMDADLYIVTDQFADLFRLVDNTWNILGCNERIKWTITDIYKLDGEPLLPEKTRLDKFHCNVPLFLDVNEWQEVFADYLKIVYRGLEHRDGQEKTIGDIYSWNIAVCRMKREDDVILMGMPGMTQVHRTGYRDKNCALQVTGDGYWTTGDGDQVYTLHCRPDKPAFRNVQHKDEFDAIGVDKNIYLRYVKAVEKEWLDLNFNYVVDLRDFQENKHWEKMGI